MPREAGQDLRTDFQFLCQSAGGGRATRCQGR